MSAERSVAISNRAVFLVNRVRFLHALKHWMAITFPAALDVNEAMLNGSSAVVTLKDESQADDFEREAGRLGVIVMDCTEGAVRVEDRFLSPTVPPPTEGA